MNSKHEYLSDIWPKIFGLLNEANIRKLMLVDTYFNKLIDESKLLERPKWYWTDYTSITDSFEITNPAYMYDTHSFPNGDLAFSLNQHYIDAYEMQRFVTAGARYLSYPNWKDHLNILVFCSGKNQPTLLKGHEGAIIHVIQHDVNTLVSLGCDGTIKIWDKFDGTLKNTIEPQTTEPSKNREYLIALNYNELACINKNCSADVWNIRTGEYVRQLFHIEGQIIYNYLCRRQNNLLLIQHYLPSNDVCLNNNYSFTVWDIKLEKIIEQVNLTELKPKLLECGVETIKKHPLMSEQYYTENDHAQFMKVIDYQNGIAIIDHVSTNCFYLVDTKNENTFFCFPSPKTQYRFLEDGTIVILTHLPNELLVYSDYCFELKDFKVKYRTDDICTISIEKNTDAFVYKINYFYDRTWTILPNGNIVTYYFNTGDAKQWCIKTQEWIKEFTLETPSPTLNMENNRNRKRFTCLPDGSILACDTHGIIAIWDSKTGRLLLNINITTPNKNNMDLITDNAEYSEILPNGNFLAKWRDTVPSNNIRYSTYDHRREKLFRFSIWDKAEEIDNTMGSDQKNTL